MTETILLEQAGAACAPCDTPDLDLQQCDGLVKSAALLSVIALAGHKLEQACTGTPQPLPPSLEELPERL